MLDKLKNTLRLRLYTMFKVPMIAFLRPTVEELNDSRCVVRVPLSRRSRNHQGMIYFGVICMGGDLAGGAIAIRHMLDNKQKVSVLFKDLNVEFLARAEDDVYFTCEDGEKILDLMKQATQTRERLECKILVTATVPSKLGEEPVAKLKLTFSVKGRA